LRVGKCTLVKFVWNYRLILLNISTRRRPTSVVTA